MFETKYSKFLTILLVIIIVAIFGLLGYLGYSYYKSYTLDKDAADAASKFVQETTQNIIEGTGNVVNPSVNENTTGNTSISENIAAANMTSTNGGTRTYKGFEMIGTIEIQKTNINYPILQAPPTPKKLEVSVAAVYPKVAQLNTVGNVVISGHNFRNGTFFSNNKNLTEGDKIYITDLTGRKVAYTVYKAFLTDKSETEFYNRDTDGKMEITLSTCADDSTTQRVIVQARAD